MWLIIKGLALAGAAYRAPFPSSGSLVHRLLFSLPGKPSSSSHFAACALNAKGYMALID